MSTLATQPAGASELSSNAKISKKILVLGATSGIAEATCRIWAAQGAQLFLVARNAEKLEAVAADLKTRGASYVGTAVADLDDTDKHADLLSHAVNSLTGMDVAYLAHGILGEQPKAEQDFEHAAQIIHTNFVAPVSLLTWLSNFCVTRHAGVLAVISSVAGDRGRKSNYLYGSSKAGLSAFLAGLRNRIDREGVTVLTIKPGPVKTAMTAGMKGSEKFADVNKVAATIVKAIDAKADNLYVPFQWQPIMFVIRNIPDRVFKEDEFVSGVALPLGKVRKDVVGARLEVLAHYVRGNFHNDCAAGLIENPDGEDVIFLRVNSCKRMGVDP